MGREREREREIEREREKERKKERKKEGKNVCRQGASIFCASALMLASLGLVPAKCHRLSRSSHEAPAKVRVRFEFGAEQLGLSQIGKSLDVAVCSK